MEDPTMESEDQSQEIEESTPDQPEEESNQEVESDDQPETESVEETVEINGQDIPLSELKAGYMRQSDYTRKTQELAAAKRDTQPPKAQLNDEQRQIQGFIKDNEIMTKDQFQQLMADNNDINSLRSQGLTSKQERILKSLSRSSSSGDSGVPYSQMTMVEIYQDVFAGKPEQPKVVRKKVVGLKPKSGKKSSGKLTREMIDAMSIEEYEKRKPEIMKAMHAGQIT